MKHGPLSALRAISKAQIVALAGLVVLSSIAATVNSMTSFQQQQVAESLKRINTYAVERGYTGANLALYYNTVRIIFQDQVDVYNGIISGLPTTPGTTPANPTAPTCKGAAPTGSNVIKSISVGGMVGSDTWSYVTNTRGTSADLGMSCQWTCAPGFVKGIDAICVVGGGTIPRDPNPPVCSWQYYPVAGPVTASPNPGTTACTTSINGTNAMQVGGSMKVATCVCRDVNVDYGTGATPSPTPANPTSPKCGGAAPSGSNIIKSTSVFGMVGSSTWTYVTNTKGTSTDLGMTCQWTCAPGFVKGTDAICVARTGTTPPPTNPTSPSCSGLAPSGSNIIKSTNVTGGIQDTVWTYVTNTRGTNTDLGASCKWTCAPGYRNTPNAVCVSATTVLSLTDTSISDGNIITVLKQTITGAPENLMACTQPDSVDANCNPTINLQTTTSDEWQYEGNGVYSIEENVTSYKYPDVTYRSCYREVTGAIKCFTFKAKVAGTSTPTNPSSPTCKGVAPSGSNIIKSTNVTGGIQDTVWSYVTNTKGTSTDLGAACKWTCAPGFVKGTDAICVAAAGTSQSNFYPITVYTDRSLSTPKTDFKRGETVYGYIEGGTLDNTWGCLDSPNTDYLHLGGCRENGTWRRLTVPYNGDPDVWQVNPTTRRIELRGGIYLDPGFPAGTYIGYTREGQSGNIRAKEFILR